jgi:hypothetical protein
LEIDEGIECGKGRFGYWFLVDSYWLDHAIFFGDKLLLLD